MNDDTLLSKLRSVTSIDEKTGLSQDGSVKFVIIDRNKVGVRVGKELIQIPAEPGQDKQGRNGWSISKPEADMDADTLEAALSVVRMGLKGLGYIVWD